MEKETDNITSSIKHCHTMIQVGPNDPPIIITGEGIFTGGEIYYSPNFVIGTGPMGILLGSQFKQCLEIYHNSIIVDGEVCFSTSNDNATIVVRSVTMKGSLAFVPDKIKSEPLIAKPDKRPHKRVIKRKAKGNSNKKYIINIMQHGKKSFIIPKANPPAGMFLTCSGVGLGDYNPSEKPTPISISMTPGKCILGGIRINGKIVKRKTSYNNDTNILRLERVKDGLNVCGNVIIACEESDAISIDHIYTDHDSMSYIANILNELFQSPTLKTAEKEIKEENDKKIM